MAKTTSHFIHLFLLQVKVNFKVFNVTLMNENNVICSKSIKTDIVLTKREMNNNWNINFLQDILLGIQHTYSNKFSIV